MSVTKHPQQRVAVFIDTQNLYHSAKNLYGGKVNFANLLEEAVGGRQLIRAKAYVVNTESGEENPFFEALEKLGIEIKTKDIQIFHGGAKKADWDVGLAIDAITVAPKLDAIVLISGDGDFVPMVEYLQVHSGCQVEVISFGRSSSHLLKDACDEFIDMDEDKQKYLIGGRRYTAKRRPSQKKVVENDTKDIQESDVNIMITQNISEKKQKPAFKSPKKEVTRETKPIKKHINKKVTQETRVRKKPSLTPRKKKETTITPVAKSNKVMTLSGGSLKQKRERIQKK